MSGIIAEITIENKDSYNENQNKLIEIWNSYLERFNDTGNDLGYIFLSKKATNKINKTNIRYVYGIRAEFVGYVPYLNDREVVKVETMNFILLMAKSGIKVNIEKIQDVIGKIEFAKNHNFYDELKRNQVKKYLNDRNKNK